MHRIQKNKTPAFFALLSLPSTAMGFALSIQISALSWILTTQYQLDIHDVGLVWAAGPLAGIIGQVLIGLVSDKAWFWGGRRRPFIVVGGVLASLMLRLSLNVSSTKLIIGEGHTGTDAAGGVHEHLPLGEGEIDFHPVMEALEALNRPIHLSVELSRHGHEAVRQARKSYDYLADRR